MPNLTSELAYWINEREAIRIAKEAVLSPPWTNDHTMATTRWCNVHREDDKVTRWMAEHWRDADKPLWWSVLGRMVNYIPSLEVLLGCNSPEECKTILKARRDEGEKIWTSAYTISTCGRKMDKVDYVIDIVIEGVRFDEKYINYSTLRSCYTGLIGIDGLGSFLAGQVVADLKNTPLHPLQTAPDWFTWCSWGTGSLRGLKWYYGCPTGSCVTPRNFQDAIEQCYEETMPFLHEALREMHMQDFQNCLCEFGKFMKIKTGVGHARNRYVAG